MGVSRRLRFEVLRRDGHVCRYCGARSPEVKLVVDHVVPEALGGRTEPANLVTSCEPCNSGKTSTAPDSVLVEDVASDALRWSRAISAAAAQMLADQEVRDEGAATFERRWNESRSWTLPPDWRASVDRFLSAGLPMPVLLACLDKAVANKNIAYSDTFRYMCGIAWKKVTELQEAARRQLGDTAPPSLAAGCRAECDWTCSGHHDDPYWRGREDLAHSITNYLGDLHPDLLDDAIHWVQEEEMAEDPADRMIPGEQNPLVLLALSMAVQISGALAGYELTVRARLRRLSPEDLAWCNACLERESQCAGVPVSHETERRHHLLRYMLDLVERVEVAA